MIPVKPKVLILDRDGTLIEHVPYLSDPAEVRLLPGAVESLQVAIAGGAKLFLHTNQSGIGRGMFKLADADACNARMIELLGLGPQLFTRVCIAPESPGEPSRYRKPSPEFASEIMRDHGFNADELCYLGDRGSDLATAHAAGTRGVGVATGLDDLALELSTLGLQDQFPIFSDLPSAMHHLFPPS